MNIRNVRVAAFVAVVVGGAPAFADYGSWGTPEQTKPCVESLDNADCKAEIARRAQICMTDPDQAGNRERVHERFPNDKAKGDKAWDDSCAEKAKMEVQHHLEKFVEQQKRAEKNKADLEAVEVPKAETHDAKLEKMVQTSYEKNYPGNKVLKVVLGSWSDDYEKDAFGRVTGRDIDATVVNKQADGKCQLHDELWMQRGSGKSFSGPLTPRGAGSMKQTEMLCTKAEAAAGAASGKKTKK